jgi:hypothetical protein
MFRPVIININVRLFQWGLAIILAAALSLWFAQWRYATYRNTTGLALVQNMLQAEIARSRVIDDAFRAELKDIQRTLYTEPESKLRQPSMLEAWSINRDNELRARIKRLEEWRMKQP